MWWFPRVPEHLPPPATEDQLQATEDLLGFSLLPALRVLYKRVANGGFGPGWDGLFCTPGCQDARSWVLTDQYQFLKEGKQPIALSACEQRMFQRGNDYAKYLADWEIRVPRGYWPERLLPLSHDGCAIFYFLDVPTGRVFLDDEGLFALRLMANSLEELFERWMRDDLSEHPALPVKGSRQLNDQFPFDDPFDPFLDLDL